MNESIVRTLSGLVYIALLVGATLNPISFVILFGLFMVISIYEFCKLVSIRFYIPIISALALFLAYVTHLYNYRLTWFFSIISVATGIYLIYKLFALKRESQLKLWLRTLLVLGYVVAPFLLIIKLSSRFTYGNDLTEFFSPQIIVGCFVIIWTNDTFAYIVGKTMGKHKLFERISPKKTVEGFLGGMVFAMVAAYVLSIYFNILDPLQWIVSAVILVVFGTLGDLVESKFKRSAGVKDSGNIMPGHGGILDRLDSIIFAIPFLFLYYQIIHYVS